MCTEGVCHTARVPAADGGDRGEIPLHMVTRGAFPPGRIGAPPFCANQAVRDRGDVFGGDGGFGTGDGDIGGDGGVRPTDTFGDNVGGRNSKGGDGQEELHGCLMRG